MIHQMRVPWVCGVVLLLGFVVSCPAQADIVFSIAKVTPGPINKGTDAVFEVLGRTSVGTQSFSWIAFDVVLSRSDGVGGVFTTHTNNIGGFGWSVEEVGTKALFEGQSISGFNSLGTADRAIGTITLSTVDPSVLEGGYSVSLSIFSADDGNATVPTSFAGPLAYSITSVPEPSTVILLSAISLGVAGGRFRRWFSRSR
jgi:hypothetical protein